MFREMRLPVVLVIAVAAAGVVLSADVKFTSMFKSIDAGTVTFLGKKVAALVMSQDMSLRMSAEEALVRELKARGIEGVATYRIAPKEELADAERARPWFEKANIEGVVALRPISMGQRTTYNVGMWGNPYYNTLWGYYGYGWNQAYLPLERGSETVLVVENLIYSVPKNSLLWAAMTETTNPRNLQKYLTDLVKATVKQMHEQGLAKKQPK